MNFKSIFTRIMVCMRSMVDSTVFLEQHRISSHFVRRRKLSMRQVIVYLLYSYKCQMSLNASNILEDLEDLEFPSRISKQAISKARKGIAPSLFREFYRLTVRTYYEMIDHRKTWNGYYVFATDGSKLQLPNEASNIETFGSRFNPADTKQVYSLAMCSTLYDVLEDIIVDASLNPDLTSERYCAQEHVKAIIPTDILNNAVIVYDRGYYSARLYCSFCEQNQLCLIRIRDNIKIAQNCENNDEIIQTITDPDTQKQFSARIIRVPLDSGITEYLITNLFDEQIRPEMFKDLYFRRWRIECKYRELKSQWKMEEFSGANSISVMQGFYINMMYTNLSSIVKNYADPLVEKNSKPTNKCKYQADRAFIIGRTKRLIPRLLCGILNRDKIADLFNDAPYNKSEVKPNRCYERRIKRDFIRNHFNHRKTVL